MIQKMENALLRAFLKARLEMMKLEQEEDGMETLEVVILAAVAVIVAGLIINGLGSGDDDGLIGHIFTSIKTKIDELIG